MNQKSTLIINYHTLDQGNKQIFDLTKLLQLEQEFKQSLNQQLKQPLLKGPKIKVLAQL